MVEENIVGSVMRNFFLENIILGRHGYGIHLHSKKKIRDIMAEPSLIFEASTNIEKVSQKILHRKNEFLYDDVYVTKNGKYFGIVPVYVLLDAITDRNIALAKNANPLSGLPGNESINLELSKKIKLKDIFDVCYIDINNFKPYNDHYGFDRGDYVIKCLADIINTRIEPYGDFCFVGHLGGDDFILITPPSLSEKICMDIVKDFEKLLPYFHNKEDFDQGFYISTNRKNEKEAFSLLSISIAIVEVNTNINSIPELASRASELKKYAKIQSYKSGKSTVIKDRRK